VAEVVQVTDKVVVPEEPAVAEPQTQVPVKQEQLTEVQAVVVDIIHQITQLALAVQVLLLYLFKD
tara:strand:- start:37 stop:231 length:195 start_codon:yes stop_codon:yes gene_type:complete